MDSSRIVNFAMTNVANKFEAGELTCSDIQPNGLSLLQRVFQIDVAGRKFDLLPSAAVIVSHSQIGQQIQFPLPETITAIRQNRRVPDIRSGLQAAAQKLPTWIETADLLRTKIAYCRIGTRLNGYLIPCRRFDVAMRGSGKAATAVLIV
jgi:hypothetical protein